MGRFWERLHRRKLISTDFLHYSEWNTALGSLDLLGMAASISLPLGIYIFVPICARDFTGPSCVLSVLIAFVVTFLAGMHLVELARSLPKSCLLYNYVYASFGEIWAFMLGWATLADYTVAGGLVAKKLALHADHLFNGSLYRLTLMKLAEPDSTFWEPQLDFLALIWLTLATVLIASSVRVSGTVSLILGTVCTLIVSSSILVGFFYASSDNWTGPGFFPNGILGVLSGSTYLLYSYVGIEALTYILEETSHPEKRLPVIAPLINFILTVYFFLLSLSITLALDYRTFAATVVLPKIYGKISVPASRYVLSVGSVCGLSGALIAISIPCSRILKTLASDGLLPGRLARLSPRNGSPLVAIATSFVASAATLFVRVEVLSDLLTFTLPVRLLLIIIVTVLQRYRTSPIGANPEVSSYHNMNRVHPSESFVTMNGSVSTLPGSESVAPDQYSLTSSFICRNIAIMQMGSQSFLPTKSPVEDSDPTIAPPTSNTLDPSGRRGANSEIDERSSLLEPVSRSVGTLPPQPVSTAAPDSKHENGGGGMVKSVSRYNSMSRIDKSCPFHSNQANGTKKTFVDDGSSLQTVSLGPEPVQEIRYVPKKKRKHTKHHDCLKSPCSPHSPNDPCFHLYERSNPELPFYDSSTGYIRSRTMDNQSVAQRKSARLIAIFVVLSIFAGLTIRFGSNLLEEGNPFLVIQTITVFLPLPILSVLIGRIPRNKETSLVKHRAPAFPYLSLLGVSLLCILISTNQALVFVKALAWSTLGTVFYFCYGYRRSAARTVGNSDESVVLENRSVIEGDTSRMVLPHTPSQSSLVLTPKE